MNEEDLLYLNSQPDGNTVLRTESLEIRELVRKNASSVLCILADCPEGSFMLPDLALPGPASDEQEFEAAASGLGVIIASDITDQYRFFGYGLWGVFHDGQIIGLAMLKNGSASNVCEIGYAILSEYRRKKFMTEAMLAVLEHARSCGFHTAGINITGDNPVSLAFWNNLKKEYNRRHCYNDVDSFNLTL